MNIAIGKIKSLCNISFLILAFSLYTNAYAHEPGTLTDSSVDRMNDTIYKSVLEVQTELSRLFQRTNVATTWPDSNIVKMREGLLHINEEAEHSLEYFLGIGVNIQSPEILRENPLAGRAVAGAQAVDVAMNLLRHVNSLASQDDFVKEIYGSGLSAYMYNLLGAHREKMELFAEITKLKNQ